MSDIISDKTLLLHLGTGDVLPTAFDLRHAPFLDGWRIELFALLGHRVVGVVSGHPLLADGVINTSNPVHADVDGGWMLTQSRFYRLGRHADELGALS